MGEGGEAHAHVFVRATVLPCVRVRACACVRARVRACVHARACRESLTLRELDAQR